MNSVESWEQVQKRTSNDYKNLVYKGRRGRRNMEDSKRAPFWKKIASVPRAIVRRSTRYEAKEIKLLVVDTQLDLKISGRPKAHGNLRQCTPQTAQTMPLPRWRGLFVHLWPMHLPFSLSPFCPCLPSGPGCMSVISPLLCARCLI